MTKKRSANRKNDVCGGKRLKASFTVEAALIMPVVIVLLVFLLHLTIGLYENVSEVAENITRIEELDSVKLFRGLSTGKELMEGLTDGF